MPRDGTAYAQAYKRDWPRVNEGLVRRGELYLDLAWVGTWDDEVRRMNDGKRGRPYGFPESLMAFLRTFRSVLDAPLRQLEGFLRSLGKVLPTVRPADYTTIWRRLARMEALPPVLPAGDGPIVVAVDSTGIKVTDRGEWMRETWHRHGGWIKVHVAVSVRGGVVALEVTDERTADTTVFPSLIQEAVAAVGHGRISDVLADAAYDSRRNFAALADAGIRPGIKIRAGASRKSLGVSARPRAVRELRRLGYDGWRDAHGYGRRWAVEGTFSAVKRIFGESVRARRRDLMVREVRTKFALYNALLQGGT
ncbi:MAG: IS5 family transposase [Candidatus Thermoplasmatota archaeon]